MVAVKAFIECIMQIPAGSGGPSHDNRQIDIRIPSHPELGIIKVCQFNLLYDHSKFKEIPNWHRSHLITRRMTGSAYLKVQIRQRLPGGSFLLEVPTANKSTRLVSAGFNVLRNQDHIMRLLGKVPEVCLQDRYDQTG